MKRILAASFLVIFSGSVLGYLWHGRFQYHHRWWIVATYGLAGAVVLVNLRVFPRSLRELGLTWPIDSRGRLAYGILTLAGLVLILFAAGAAGPTSFAWAELQGLPLYLGWALLQQFILQNVLRSSALVLIGGDWRGGTGSAIVPASLLAAVLFGAFHLPHPVLAPLTFVAATGWCWIFSRSPSLPATALSHVLLASTLLLTGQGRVLDSFGVGKQGFRYQGYGDGIQVAAGWDRAGSPVVVTLPGPDRGRASQIRVATPDGRLLAAWTAFPEYDFSGRFAVADLGLGPGDEVVVVPGPGSGNPALVRIFSLDGRRLESFPVAGLAQGYGANISVACRGILIGSGPAPGAPPVVVWLDAAGRELHRWDFEGRLPFVNGIKAWAAPHACPPDALLLAGTEVSVNPAEIWLWRNGEGVPVEVFPATYGLNLAVADTNPGVVLAGPGPLWGYPRWLRLFQFNGAALEMTDDFVVPGPEPAAGVAVALLDLDGDGLSEFVVGEGTVPGSPGRVRIVDRSRRILYQWDVPSADR